MAPLFEVPTSPVLESICVFGFQCLGDVIVDSQSEGGRVGCVWTIATQFRVGVEWEESKRSLAEAWGVSCRVVVVPAVSTNGAAGPMWMTPSHTAVSVDSKVWGSPHQVVFSVRPSVSLYWGTLDGASLR